MSTHTAPFDPSASTPHPALDFVPFGVGGWSGPQWVEFFDGEVGQPVWSVVLGNADGDARLSVCTAPRDRWDATHAPNAPDSAGASDGANPGAAELASRWLFQLAGMRRPPLDDSLRGAYYTRTVRFAERTARRWPTWPTCTWTIEGEPRPAHVMGFARSWLGLCHADPTRYLLITGHEVDPDGLTLAGVEARTYGVDWSAPFGLGDLARQAERPTWPAPDAAHPDHDLVWNA